MSIPKEPRQIMINLMYLVLTAMLALNVSNEILHAFKIINGSMVRSNQSVDANNQETLVALQANEDMEGQRERVKPYNDKAKELHTEVEQVFQYLEGWKKKIVAEAGGYQVDNPAEIKREDDIDASTRLLVEKGGGNEIKAKLLALKSSMLEKVNPDSRASLDKELPLQITPPPKSEENTNSDWAFGTFHNVPVLAAVTLFSKMQNDIRNSEAAILKVLFDEANAKQIKFDAIAAIAVPKTSYALQGQQVEAQIMLAAYNKSVSPSIRASSGQVKVAAGVGTWTGTASGIGMQTVKGTLSLNLGNRTVNEPWEFNYMVGTAGGSIQLDKMNVFYIGVDNPISISAAGYSMEDARPNIPGATMTQTSLGHYNVRVTTPGNIVASVIAKTPQGDKELAKLPIRVKLIPDPKPMVGRKPGGVIAANILKAQMGVEAVLENFEFDTRFDVVSFSYQMKQKKNPDLVGPYPVNDAYFNANPTVKQLIQDAKPGDRIFFDEIRAKGPDGRVRNLGTIAFTVI